MKIKYGNESNEIIIMKIIMWIIIIIIMKAM
jgi:hypothetical protein